MSRQYHDSPPDPLGKFGTAVLGIYLIALPLILCVLIVSIWPSVRSDGITADSLLGIVLGRPLSTEITFILLVMVAGTLGSYVHSATSFGDYVGNRRLDSSWVWWYILRSFIGLSLAVLFYFVIRGGLLSAGATAGSMSPFGVAAVSGLVGLFSKQATDKMREVFDTLFRTERPVPREDKLSNPRPEITDIEPRTGAVSSGDVRLVVRGKNFIPTSVVRFAGRDFPTTVVSPSQLEISIPAGALAMAGDIDVTVYNPPPGGGSSTAEIFKIQAVDTAKDLATEVRD